MHSSPSRQPSVDSDIDKSFENLVEALEEGTSESSSPLHREGSGELEHTLVSKMANDSDPLKCPPNLTAGVGIGAEELQDRLGRLDQHAEDFNRRVGRLEVQIESHRALSHRSSPHAEETSSGNDGSAEIARKFRIILKQNCDTWRLYGIVLSMNVIGTCQVCLYTRGNPSLLCGPLTALALYAPLMYVGGLEDNILRLCGSGNRVSVVLSQPHQCREQRAELPEARKRSDIASEEACGRHGSLCRCSSCD